MGVKTDGWKGGQTSDIETVILSLAGDRETKKKKKRRRRMFYLFYKQEVFAFVFLVSAYLLTWNFYHDSLNTYKDNSCILQSPE